MSESSEEMKTNVDFQSIKVEYVSDDRYCGYNIYADGKMIGQMNINNYQLCCEQYGVVYEGLNLKEAKNLKINKIEYIHDMNMLKNRLEKFMEDTDIEDVKTYLSGYDNSEKYVKMTTCSLFKDYEKSKELYGYMEGGFASLLITFESHEENEEPNFCIFSVYNLHNGYYKHSYNMWLNDYKDIDGEI